MRYTDTYIIRAALPSTDVLEVRVYGEQDAEALVGALSAVFETEVYVQTTEKTGF